MSDEWAEISEETSKDLKPYKFVRLHLCADKAKTYYEGGGIKDLLPLVNLSGNPIGNYELNHFDVNVVCGQIKKCDGKRIKIHPKGVTGFLDFPLYKNGELAYVIGYKFMNKPKVVEETEASLSETTISKII